jgi:hypothetical protein
MKFKIKGNVIEELPEMEIEAETREEAEGKYGDMYENEEIDSDGYFIDFDSEDEQV